MAYFDNAATTYPKPECVYQEMDRVYRQAGGSAGRGQHSGSAYIGQLLLETRQYIKEIMHCPSKEVIFAPTGTLALNMIIQGLLKNNIRNVYISPFEHNAVTRILHSYAKAGLIQVKQLKVDNTSLEYDFAAMEADFQVCRPELVIISHASNVIGLISPVEEIFALAKKYGAYTVADMSQSAGLVDITIGENFDFAVFAGHKTLYGPTGISGFVMKPDIELPSVLFGGTGYDSANQDMPDRLPEKYEMGTMNTSAIAGLHASLKWLLDTGIDNIWQKEQQHRQRLLDILKDFPFMRTVGIATEAKYVGIISCIMTGISSDSASGIFTDRDIALRTGLQCAPMAHQFLGTYPAGTIRFSTSYFTTDEDFHSLERALEDIEDSM